MLLISSVFAAPLQAERLPRLDEVTCTLQARNITLRDALDSLERQTDFRFVYDSRAVQDDRPVTANLVKVPLNLVLSKLLDPLQIRYQVQRRNIVLTPQQEVRTRNSAPAADGWVRGVVRDATSGTLLPGATLKLADNLRGTFANHEGQYVLPLPPGTYSIEVTYLGYQAAKQTVTIESGRVTVLDWQLSPRSFELSDIVIAGNLDGQAKALNQQFAADNIQTVVAADQIGRFPDPNVAEALQRVPGATLQRDQGEGRYISIRGLSPAFTNISVNGEQIPSPEADVRFIALDVLGADQLSSIEVNKTLIPEMDGDAVGGAVNLNTRGATSTAWQLTGSLAGGFNNLMERGQYQGHLQLGRRLGQDGKFGFLLNGNYYLSELGSDNIEAEYDDDGAVTVVELRDYELTRDRAGISGTFDYKFSPRSEIYLRTLYSRFSDLEYRRRITLEAGEFDEDEVEGTGVLARDNKERKEIQDILSLNLGGRHLLGTWQLDYEVSFARARQDTPFDRNVEFEQDNRVVRIDNTRNTNRPQFTAFDPDDSANEADWSQVDPLDNTGYEFNEYEISNTLAEDENRTARFNLAKRFNLANNNTFELKFGGKGRQKDKTFTKNFDIGEYNGSEDLTLDRFQGGLLDNNFLGGDYRLTESVDVGRFIAFLNANRGDFERDEEGITTENALESFTASEDVYAGYLQGRFQWNKLTLTGGVRYEATRVEYQSSEVVVDEAGDFAGVEPVRGSNDYNFLLPMLNAKFALSPRTNLRAAVTQSFARPNFGDIIPSQETNLEDREAFRGNPNLKPVGATNVDLMLDHYFETIGWVSVGAYYKRLNDFIYTRASLQNIRGVDDVLVFQAQNGEQANLYGLELAYQQNLTFLPGILSGLNLYANYTWTYSEATIQNRLAVEDGNFSLPDETVFLPGTARHVGNLGLGYTKGGFQGRILLNFNSRILEEIGANASRDSYADSRIQLDFSAQQVINDNFRLFVELVNLTNQPLVRYQGMSSRPLQQEYYSWWGRLGVRFNF